MRALRAAALMVACLSAAACTASGETGADGSSGVASSTTQATPAPPANRGATFIGHGVSFSYPSGWKGLRVSDSSASAGAADWTHSVGIDARNMISVSAFTLDAPVTEANLEARRDAIRAELENLFAQAGGSLVRGPSALEISGLPALSFAGTARTPSGATVASRLVLAFDGTTEYFLNCQSDHRGRDRILAGCERVLSTFALRD